MQVRFVENFYNFRELIQKTTVKVYNVYENLVSGLYTAYLFFIIVTSPLKEAFSRLAQG